MIPPQIASRLADLRELVERYDTEAGAMRAEIRGIETAIEAYEAQAAIEAVIEAEAPVPMPTMVEVRSTKRNLRGLIRDLVKREPGLSSVEIAERIGRCRELQVAAALAKDSNFVLRDGGWRPREGMQEAAQ